MPRRADVAVGRGAGSSRRSSATHEIVMRRLTRSARFGRDYRASETWRSASGASDHVNRSLCRPIAYEMILRDVGRRMAGKAALPGRPGALNVRL